MIFTLIFNNINLIIIIIIKNCPNSEANGTPREFLNPHEKIRRIGNPDLLLIRSQSIDRV
jgi:hypothetical protein